MKDGPISGAGLVVDLNADVGEGYGAWLMGDDEALMEVVTSANVACGFHAGDPSAMAATVTAAAARGVAVGAHVSYPDLVGFGRRAMDVSGPQLRCDVAYQLGALDGVARLAGATVCHVKAHGALYHRVNVDPVAAAALVDAMATFDPSLALVCPPGSVAATIALERGMRVLREAFADRAYTAHGDLLPRGCAGAVVDDEAQVADRAVRLATRSEVVAVDGTVLHVAPDTICVHGDTPGAGALARAMRDSLTRAGVAVRSFASTR